jgi:hypothetical protein
LGHLGIGGALGCRSQPGSVPARRISIDGGDEMEGGEIVDTHSGMNPMITWNAYDKLDFRYVTPASSS